MGLRGEPGHRAGDHRHVRRRPLHVASNFPVAGLRIDFTSLYDAYKRMVVDFNATEQLALFHDTAAKFYAPAHLEKITA